MRTSSRLIGGTACLLVALGTATAAPAHAQDAPGPLVSASTNLDSDLIPVLAAASPDRRRLYTAFAPTSGGAGALSWIEPSAPRETRTAKLGSRPTGLSVSPDGRRLASSSASDTFVRVFNTANGRLIAKIPVGGHPDAVVIGPKGKSLFASVNKGASIVKVDMTSMKTTGRYPVKDRANNCHGRPPVSLAVTADSATLLVSCPAGGLFVMRTSDGRSIGGIDQADGGLPVSSPDGTHAYWGSRNELWGLDIPRFPMVFTNDLLIPSDGDAPDVISRIRAPLSLALTPDGSKLYAAMPDIGAVSIVAPGNSKTQTSRISLAGSDTFGAQQLAMDPSGKRLYITTADGRLVTVDTASDSVVGVDPLPFAATGPRSATRISTMTALADSRLALGWSTYDGPGGSLTGSGVTILTLR